MASSSSVDKEKEHAESAGSGNDIENNAQMNEIAIAASEVGTAGRVPFTSLSQVDADLALARALQEQERAYLLLRMGSDGSEFNSSDSNSGRFEYEGDNHNVPADRDAEHDREDEEEEEEEEVEAGEGEEEQVREGGAVNEEQIDGALFDSDEAFARALQEKEDRDTTARLMALAGIHDLEGDFETDSNDSQDNMWQDVDPDNMSYEELIALGEAVGTESRGLSAQAIAALPGFTHVSDPKDGINSQEQCVVCRHEYEEGDAMLTLPCKHKYHSECIQQWLQINKVCPVCSAEVLTSGASDSQPRS